MRTLSQILVDANAYLDLDATLPTGTELTTRVNYANQAVWDASAFVQLREFHSIYEVTPSINASISLPSGFREFMGVPRQQIDGGWDEFPQIEPMDRFNRETSEKYCYVMGNPSTGYTAVFNNLTANAPLSLDYQRFPSGFATLTDVCELPDPMYVVEKIEASVLESRSDDRFPSIKASAGNRLSNMIGRGSKKPGGGTNSIPKTGSAGYSLG